MLNQEWEIHTSLKEAPMEQILSELLKLTDNCPETEIVLLLKIFWIE